MVEEAESGEKMKEGRERGEKGRKRGGEKRERKSYIFSAVSLKGFYFQLISESTTINYGQNNSLGGLWPPHLSFLWL